MSTFKEEALDYWASHSARKAVACFIQDNWRKGNKLAATTPNANPQTMLCINIALPIQVVADSCLDVVVTFQKVLESLKRAPEYFCDVRQLHLGLFSHIWTYPVSEIAIGFLLKQGSHFQWGHSLK